MVSKKRDVKRKQTLLCTQSHREYLSSWKIKRKDIIYLDSAIIFADNLCNILNQSTYFGQWFSHWSCCLLVDKWPKMVIHTLSICGAESVNKGRYFFSLKKKDHCICTETNISSRGTEHILIYAICYIWESTRCSISY